MQFITSKTADNLDLIRKILADDGFKSIQKIIRLSSGSRSLVI